MTTAASRQPGAEKPEPSGPPPSSPGFTLQEDIWFGDFSDDQARSAAATSLTAMGGRIMGARPIPAAAQKLVQLTRDEDADVHKVVRVLEMDPGLSQKILRLVNSAGYGLRIRCTSLQHATALLGQVKLRQVATSAVLFDHFGKSSALTRKKQEHGAVVASLCRYLAIHLGLPQDDLFTIGLLHDIGELMMLDDDLAGYPALLEESDGEFDALHIREREHLGFDHAVLAAHVLASWSIPSPLPEVIALHHQPAVAHQHSLDVAAMVQTLRFADQMAHLLEHKSPKRSIGILAESEAASYLDFSEVQIAAMWRDLERVQEVTKNRRLNIMDMAPRSVTVPESLRPREVPFSARPHSDERRDLNPESMRTRGDQIAVPSYQSPLALISQATRRADGAEPALSPLSQASSRGAAEPKPFFAFAPTDPSELTAPSRGEPVFVPLSNSRIELPTHSVSEEGSNADDRSPEPPEPGPTESPRTPPAPERQPMIRPIFDGAHTDEAMLARLTGSALAQGDGDPSAAPMPEAEPPLPSAPRAENPPEDTEQPWFEEASTDVSPEVFPCSFCYAPTFGASCSVCHAQTCPEHQLTSRQWCVACEDEFQTFLQSQGTSPMVPLAVGVSLAVSVFATGYFASMDGALGVLSIGAVLVFGLFVLHHVSLKRRFRIARKRALEEANEQSPAPPAKAQKGRDDPISRALEAIAEDDEPSEREESSQEGSSPLSMPVPAPRAHALVVAPICEPPRPSLLNFKRDVEHVPVFESLLAPKPAAEPAGAPIRIIGAAPTPIEELPDVAAPRATATPTWPAPSHDGQPKAPESELRTAELPDSEPSAPETQAAVATEQASLSLDAGRESSPNSTSGAEQETPDSVAPLAHSLRAIEREPASEAPAAPQEPLTAVGYSAEVCASGALSGVIVVPELKAVQSFCVGIPQNTVTIESRSA